MFASGKGVWGSRETKAYFSLYSFFLCEVLSDSALHCKFTK